MALSWINRFELKKGKWIYEPSLQCRQNGELVVKHLNKKWKKPPYYYHFQNGGHVQALKNTLNHSLFATLDIKNFFPSISRSRITRTLKKYFSYKTAREIAKESTLKHSIPEKHSHSLPYGFIQSPILASICLHKSTLGIEMDKCYKAEGVSISVYMDDIILSSDCNELLEYWLCRLKIATDKSQLSLNIAKESPIASSAIAFNIKFSKNHMIITEERFKELKNTYENSISNEQKNGIGGYVGTVNKGQAALLDL